MTATTTLVHPDAWYAENDVDLRTRTSVMKLDTAAQGRDAVDQGRGHATARRCWRTGANVRRLRSTARPRGHPLPARAAQRRRRCATTSPSADRVVLVGGSYIGAEVAASLTALGKRCAIVMQEDVVLERGFGAAGRPLLPARARGPRRRGPRRPGARPLRGRRRARRTVVCESGLELEGDAGRARRRRGAGTHARPGGRAGARGARRSASATRACGHVGRGSGPPATSCEYDSVAPRPAAAHRALGRRDRAGQDRRRANMLGAGAPRRRARTSSATSPTGRGSSTSAPARAGTRGRARLDRRRRVLGLLPRGRPVAAALAVGRSDDLDHARRLLKEGIDVDGRQMQLADREADLSELG